MEAGHLPMIFLERLEEAEGTLLDKALVMYGSPMGDPNVHNHKRCPLFLVGGANGQLAGNLHLRAKPGTPMANVMLDVIHRLGLDDIQQFGDSTGWLVAVLRGRWHHQAVRTGHVMRLPDGSCNPVFCCHLQQAIWPFCQHCIDYPLITHTRPILFVGMPLCE